MGTEKFGHIDEDHTVWDHLAVPETLADMVTLVEDWKDCQMFFPMPGPPRAYFEIPANWDEATKSYMGVHRVVYHVLGYHMIGRQVDCEKHLIAALWKDFVRIRKVLHRRNREQMPMVFWRREAEIDELPPGDEDIPFPLPKRTDWSTRVSVRIAVPGVDLGSFGHDDTMAMLSMPPIKVAP